MLINPARALPLTSMNTPIYPKLDRIPNQIQRRFIHPSTHRIHAIEKKKRKCWYRKRQTHCLASLFSNAVYQYLNRPTRPKTHAASASPFICSIYVVVRPPITPPSFAITSSSLQTETAMPVRATRSKHDSPSTASRRVVPLVLSAEGIRFLDLLDMMIIRFSCAWPWMRCGVCVEEARRGPSRVPAEFGGVSGLAFG